MACLDDAAIARVLDGELAGDEAQVARAHLVGCDECRRRAAAAIARVPDEKQRFALQETIRSTPRTISQQRLAIEAAANPQGARPTLSPWVALAIGVGVVAAPFVVPTSAGECGDPAACDDLGRRLEASRDMAGALAAFQRGCDLDGGDSCYRAATFWNDLKKLDNQDASRANTLFEKACAYGSEIACFELASNLARGRGCAQDFATAARLVAGPCTLGYGPACRFLGNAYAEGEGVPHTPYLQHYWTARACELGDPPACAWEGGALSHSEDPVTARRGVAYMQRACEADASQCFNYALATAGGRAGAPDPVKARALYARACNAGVASACNNLGMLLKEGRGGEADLVGAKAQFQRACDDGVLAGCGNLRALERDLRGK